jgi:hypothetical protein
MLMAGMFIFFVLPYLALLLSAEMASIMGVFGILVGVIMGLWVVWLFFSYLLKC